MNQPPPPPQRTWMEVGPSLEDGLPGLGSVVRIHPPFKAIQFGHLEGVQSNPILRGLHGTSKNQGNDGEKTHLLTGMIDPPSTSYKWVFPNIGIPQNGWFTMENPVKMDVLQVPLFLKTPKWDPDFCSPINGHVI